MILYDPQNRDEWLQCRAKGIGGSDAGSVLGINKYKTNVALYREKAGIERNNFTGNAATEYGKAAESHIREMFLLDHPEYASEYHEYRMHANDLYQFIYATLDGELTEKQQEDRAFSKSRLPLFRIRISGTNGKTEYRIHTMHRCFISFLQQVLTS